MKRKILFVGMPDSPHTARWINLIADEGWELHFFPVYLEPTHHLMREITIHQPWIKLRPRSFIKKLLRNPRSLFASSGNINPSHVSVKSIYPIPMIAPFDQFFSGYKTIPLGESEVCAPLPFGPHVLARLIKQLKPDLIHSMEFQHAGYNVLRAKELIGDNFFPKWLATNWGSDIFYYQRFPDHYQQITRLLKNINYYSCECIRDVGLAQELGFSGVSMPVLPNTGGFDIESISNLRSLLLPSERRMIMVKGYQHFAGRALTALDAIFACRDVLQDYRIVVFSASAIVYERVEELRMFHGLNISILGYFTHEKMLKYFAHARIYLGVNISDAISTSMLEAMALGAFPIQTNTACCDEWIRDGVSGFSIPHDDTAVISQKLRRAIIDDDLVDNAARINWHTVCARLDQKILKVKEVEFYDQIFVDIEGGRLSAK